jgi:hypothetical protein
LTAEEEEEMKGIPYRNLVGGLLWLARATRPDIAAAVSILSRFSHKPSPRHWKALLGVLKYLKGTTDLGIRYFKRPVDHNNIKRNTLYCYADSSFGNDLEDGKSTTGYIVFLNGGAVSWYSKAQDYTVQSTTEAEYMAAGKGAMEIECLDDLIVTICAYKRTKSQLFTDNTGCLYTVKNAVIGEKVRHIRNKYHYVRQLIEKGLAEITYVKTENMLADILTKPMEKAIFLKLRKYIMHK